MSQTLFGSNAAPPLPLLDQNFTQLYDWRELVTTPSYTAATPKVTLDGSGNFAFGANISAARVSAGGGLLVGATNVRNNVFMSGNVTVATNVPINTGQNVGGVLVVITGADAGGTSFSRLYLVALRLAGGGTPDIASTQVATVGSATPTFTFTNVSGFLNITSASSNISYAHFFGG